MLRSTIRRLRRTLSFRSRSKHRGSSKKAGGGTNQDWESDALNIKQQGGCSFSVKYLGCLEVSESRGTQVCSQAAHQMKMSSAGKKKQRVSLWVTEDTLRVTDEETKSLVVDQVIEKVSFCTPDPHDEKLFSYICRDGTSRRWLCHSFKGIKDSGERISHAVGCAFAACLAKKQQQNQQNQNFQRGNSTRKTLESRPNGVKLPQQSVDALQKLNQDEYSARVSKANDTLQAKTTTVSESETIETTPQSSPTAKQPPPAFARPRPSVGMDAAAFTRHASLPYRTKKSQGSATYQALTEDPLPPRIPTTPEPVSPGALDDDLWLSTPAQPVPQQQHQVNPFTAPSQTVMIQQQSGFTQASIQPVPEQQKPNPFSNNWANSSTTNANPFNEKFV
ncbi:protein numb homolog [Hydractinia symbiolongicarpus]|uniref:protein numb homolog n=1 Tax=Hydractinia symbiolongicarpus TaxID=13093 RepID=UPI00254F5401|nr:protein numb homolog [Hydractinia symbiolongicarpus]